MDQEKEVADKKQIAIAIIFKQRNSTLFSEKEFVDSILQHAKEFKDFHRNNQVKQSKITKAVLNYHTNTERERKIEMEKNEDAEKKDSNIVQMEEKACTEAKAQQDDAECKNREEQMNCYCMAHRNAEKVTEQRARLNDGKLKQYHQELLNSILQHAKKFKDFHRSNQVQQSKIKNAILNYHAEKERKKEEERRESGLVQEDDEGYGKLLDQKKDKPLVYSPEQTDEYVAGITILGKRQSAGLDDERSQSTGADDTVGDSAQETHTGYEILSHYEHDESSGEQSSDSDGEKEENEEAETKDSNIEKARAEAVIREFLDSILQHAKEFKDFHRNNQLKQSKITKAVLNYHTNTERQRKEEEERGRELMQVDERQEREEKSRQEEEELRLLAQGDQSDQSAEPDDERSQSNPADLPVTVGDSETGQILHESEVPEAGQLDALQETHPGDEVLSDDEHDESSSEKSSESSEESSDSGSEIQENEEAEKKDSNIAEMDEKAHAEDVITRQEREEKCRWEEELRSLAEGDQSNQSSGPDDERSQSSGADLPVTVGDSETGRILHESEVPEVKQLDASLETHLSDEVLSEYDESSSEKSLESSEESLESEGEMDENEDAEKKDSNIEEMDEKARAEVVITRQERCRQEEELRLFAKSDQSNQSSGPLFAESDQSNQSSGPLFAESDQSNQSSGPLFAESDQSNQSSGPLFAESDQSNGPDDETTQSSGADLPVTVGDSETGRILHESEVPEAAQGYEVLSDDEHDESSNERSSENSDESSDESSEGEEEENEESENKNPNIEKAQQDDDEYKNREDQMNYYCSMVRANAEKVTEQRAGLRDGTLKQYKIANIVANLEAPDDEVIHQEKASERKRKRIEEEMIDKENILQPYQKPANFDQKVLLQNNDRQLHLTNDAHTTTTCNLFAQEIVKRKRFSDSIEDLLDKSQSPEFDQNRLEFNRLQEESIISDNEESERDSDSDQSGSEGEEDLVESDDDLSESALQSGFDAPGPSRRIFNETTFSNQNPIYKRQFKSAIQSGFEAPGPSRRIVNETSSSNPGFKRRLESEIQSGFEAPGPSRRIINEASCSDQNPTFKRQHFKSEIQSGFEAPGPSRRISNEASSSNQNPTFKRQLVQNDPDANPYGGKMDVERDRLAQTVSHDAIAKLHNSVTNLPAETEETDDPNGLLVELKKYQRRGLTWLLWRESQDPRGGILADDMGLGKTLSMISLLLIQKQRRMRIKASDEPIWKSKILQRANLVPSHATLVICPASVLDQWVAEIERRVKPGRLKVYAFKGLKHTRESNPYRLAKYDVVVSSYQLVRIEVNPSKGKIYKAATDMHDAYEFRNDNSPKSVLLRVGWQRIILDEAHIIKNPHSLQAKAICILPAINRWCLTGTPIHNNLLDFYSLLRFLRCSPFDDLGVWNMCIMQSTAQSQGRLNTLVKGMLLRRMKTDTDPVTGKRLVKLKRKVYEKRELELGDVEKQIYDRLFKASQLYVKEYVRTQKYKGRDFDISRMEHDQLGNRFLFKGCASGGNFQEMASILTMLLRLRQACVHLALTKNGVDIDALFDGANVKKTDKILVGQVFEREYLSTKVQCLMDEVTRICLGKSGDKCVIVSQWAKLLDIVAIHVANLGIEFTRISGDVVPGMRQQRVDAFNQKNTGPRIMLLSLTAGGVGLNLIGGNHLFMLDLHWNPALEQQACDRIYRLGQTKKVYIYKFICKDTIEQRVLDIQEQKLQLAKSVLEGAATAKINKLSLGDLKFLFQLDQPKPKISHKHLPENRGRKEAETFNEASTSNV